MHLFTLLLANNFVGTKVGLQPRSLVTSGYMLTLSLRRWWRCWWGGGVVAIFPRTIFAFLLRLPYGQFTHPLSRYPCIYEKIFQKFLPCKKLGGGGVTTTPPRPEREGVAAKINKFS